MEGQTLFHRTLLNEAGDPIKTPEHTRYQIFLQIIHEDKKSATSVNRKPTLNEVYTHFESFLSLADKFDTLYRLAHTSFRICSIELQFPKQIFYQIYYLILKRIFFGLNNNLNFILLFFNQKKFYFFSFFSSSGMHQSHHLVEGHTAGINSLLISFSHALRCLSSLRQTINLT